MGVEAKPAEQPEHVLGDPPAGVADEAHAPGMKIGHAIVEVVQHAVSRQRDRVHGEIPPLRIGPPVGPVRHLRVAAVGFDIAAKRGDLEGPVRDDRRHGAVGKTGRHRLYTGRREKVENGLRRCVGRDIDVFDGAPGQRIPDTSTDESGLRPIRRQGVENADRFGRGHPRLRRERAGHRINAPWCQRLWLPGMRLPSSKRGGV